MKNLFEPYSLGSLTLKNRFVRSATGESRADTNGLLQEEIFPIYETLAAGGVGLIITGHMYVDEEWKCGPQQTGVARDEHLPGLRRLAQACQGNGTRGVAQINYVGRRPEEMSPAEIRDATERFAAAGGRVQEAGFEGVQIHAAHGYLLSGFLTPSENQRPDEYGRGAAGRRRLLLEVVDHLRRTVGSDYPILCKLGVVDGRDNSLPLEEAGATARALQEAGIAAIEVSTSFSGEHAQGAADGIDTPEKEAYFAPQAQALKQALDIPIILVGGLRSREVMQKVLREGICDLVSLCRPFIREPDWVNRMREGCADRAGR